MSANKKSIVSVGGRIRHFRVERGLSQRQLGMAVGFDENSACVRIAQYETGVRTPKQQTLYRIAKALLIPVQVLDVPQIDSPVQFMQLLFALEDACEGDLESGTPVSQLSKMLAEWGGKKEDVREGRLTHKQYRQWRCELTEL